MNNKQSFTGPQVFVSRLPYHPIAAANTMQIFVNNEICVHANKLGFLVNNHKGCTHFVRVLHELPMLLLKA